MEDNRITLAVRVDRNLHRKIKMLAMQQGKSLKEYMIDLMLDSLEKEKQIQVYKEPEKDENYIYENGKKIELLEDEKEEEYIPNNEENNTEWIYVKFLDTFFENFFIFMRPLSSLYYILNLYWYKWYTELLTFL